MFLHLCVILFTGGWLPSMHHRSHGQGGLHPGGGGLPTGPSASRVDCIPGGPPPVRSASMGSVSSGVCLQWGLGRPHGNTVRYSQQVGGMHPTGMHSC